MGQLNLNIIYNKILQIKRKIKEMNLKEVWEEEIHNNIIIHIVLQVYNNFNKI